MANSSLLATLGGGAGIGALLTAGLSYMSGAAGATGLAAIGGGLAAVGSAPLLLGAAGGAALGYGAYKGYEHFFGEKRASGGPVNMGQPYLVGERGQELFIPSQSGTIQSSDSYLTKKDFAEGINALVSAFNVEVVMDGRAVGKIVTKRTK